MIDGAGIFSVYFVLSRLKGGEEFNHDEIPILCCPKFRTEEDLERATRSHLRKADSLRFWLSRGTSKRSNSMPGIENQDSHFALITKKKLGSTLETEHEMGNIPKGLRISTVLSSTCFRGHGGRE